MRESFEPVTRLFQQIIELLVPPHLCLDRGEHLFVKRLRRDLIFERALLVEDRHALPRDDVLVRRKSLRYRRPDLEDANDDEPNDEEVKRPVYPPGQDASRGVGGIPKRCNEEIDGAPRKRREQDERARTEKLPTRSGLGCTGIPLDAQRQAP